MTIIILDEESLTHNGRLASMGALDFGLDHFDFNPRVMAEMDTAIIVRGERFRVMKERNMPSSKIDDVENLAAYLKDLRQLEAALKESARS